MATIFGVHVGSFSFYRPVVRHEPGLFASLVLFGVLLTVWSFQAVYFGLKLMVLVFVAAYIRLTRPQPTQPPYPYRW